MALTTVSTNPASQRPAQESIHAAVKELQRLKQVVVNGAGANADIAIAGIATADVLVGVIEVPANGALVDRTAVTTISSAGNIRVSQATTGNQLLVTYFDVA